MTNENEDFEFWDNEDTEYLGTQNDIDFYLD